MQWVGGGSRRHAIEDPIVPMPHVEGRPAIRVERDLIQLRVWEVMEQRIWLKISCDNCFHETIWTEGYMEKKLKRWRGQTMFRMAQSLRCGGCRSNYVRVGRNTATRATPT